MKKPAYPALGRLRLRVVSLALSTILSSAFSVSAWAQTVPDGIPPVRSPDDENGVNLATGSLQLTVPELSIGSPEKGLSYVRSWQGTAWSHGYSMYIVSPTQTISGSSSIVVVLGNRSEVFTRTATYSNTGVTYGPFVPAQGTGSTLTASGSNYIFFDRNGTRIFFDSSYIDNSAALNIYDSTFIGLQAVATTIDKTNGEKTVLSYKATTTVNPYVTSRVISLLSVNNNYGYQLKFSNNSAGQSVITAINNGVDYCAPLDASCTSLTRNWPTATHQVIGNGVAHTETSTDSLGNVTSYTFIQDANGLVKLSGVERPGHSSNDVTYNYNADGLISSVIRAGSSWNYTRTNSYAGNILQITTNVFDPLSHQRIAVTNKGAGLLISDTDALGNTTSYSYDTNGNLSQVLYPEGNKAQITFDGRGNLTATRLISKTPGSPSDIVTSNLYPATCSNIATCNRPINTIDALGNQTDYTYDGTTGLITSLTQPASATGSVRPQKRYSYAAFQATYKSSAGSATPSGLPITQLTNMSECVTMSACAGTSDEVKTQVSYDGNLQLAGISSGAGDGSLIATTTSSYDAIGNVESVDGPLAGSADTVTNRYDANRALVGSISPDPDGSGPLKRRAIKTTYNGEGQPVVTEVGTVAGTTDGDWAAFATLQQSTATYDVNSRKTMDVTTAGGTTYNVSQYSYDALGRLECSALRMNPAIWNSLPSSACTLGGTGSAGADRISKITFDAVGRVTQEQSAYGTADQANDSTSAYNANGTLRSLTDAQGNATTYQYDGFDRATIIRYPVAAVGAGASSTADFMQAGYDANGNVTSVRLRDGSSINYIYDHLGRLSYKDLPAGENDVSYGYDLLDRMTVVTRPDGAGSTLVYDQLGRKLQEGQSFGSMAWTYDLAGRKISTVWNDGFYVTYDHLVTGETTAVRENGATSGIGVLAAYAYDDLGRRTSLTRGNGTVTNYGYDPASQLTSLGLDQSGTAYDQNIGFSYSPAGQMTLITLSNDTYAWTGVANRNDASSVNGLNQITAVGAGTLGYDAKGNLSSTGATTYSYTSENRLSAVSGLATLYYDAIGRLVEYDTNVSTRFSYDGDELAAEIDNPTGTILKRYVRGPNSNEPLVEYDRSGSIYTRSWLHADERGSIIAQSDDSGATTGINTYDEYGVPGSANTGRFGYTGQAWLATIGLYNYKARMYSSRLGRFLQTDPVGYNDGMNWYTYVGGDPVNRKDPSGLDLCGLSGGLGLRGNACPDIVVTGALPVFSNFTGVTVGIQSPVQGFGSIVPQSDQSDIVVTARAIPVPPTVVLEGLGSLFEELFEPTLGTGDMLPLSRVQMAQNNNQTRKRIAGLQAQVDAHLKKLSQEPEGPAANHWRNEIKVWLAEINRLKGRLSNGR